MYGKLGRSGLRRLESAMWVLVRSKQCITGPGWLCWCDKCLPRNPAAFSQLKHSTSSLYIYMQSNMHPESYALTVIAKSSIEGRTRIVVYETNAP